MAASQIQWTADAVESTVMPPISIKPSSSRSKLRTSCDTCQQSKVKCSQAKPSCYRCLQHGLDCIYSPLKRVGRPPKSRNLKAMSSLGCKSANVAGDSGAEISQIPQTIHFSAQDDITEWNFATPDLEIQYLTPQSINCKSSDPRLSTDPAEWESHSVEKPKDEFPALPFEQGESESYANLDIFLEDSNPSSSSPYTTTSDPFDTLWEFAVEEEAQDLSMGCDVTGRSSLKELVPEVGDQEIPLHQDQEALSLNELADGVIGQTSDPRNPSCSTSRSRETVGSGEPTSLRLVLAAQPQTPSKITAPGSTFSNDASLTQTECCQSLIKSLFQLSESLVAISGVPPQDIVLLMDKELHLHKDRILNCISCRNSHRSSILLLTVVMERLVGVLERKKDRCKVPSTQPTGTSLRGCSTSGRREKRHQGSSKSYNLPPVSSLLDTECRLLIGNFEVKDETKTRFLKRLWKFRFKALLSLLGEIEQVANFDLRDINLRLAKEMVMELRRRLEALMGSLEMWE